MTLIKKLISQPNNEQIGHSISTVLEQLMDECKVTANELSQHTKIPAATISRLRNNEEANPRLSTLLPLANFFCVTLEQLIGNEPLGDRDKGSFNPESRQMAAVPLLELEDVEAWIDNSEAVTHEKELPYIKASIKHRSSLFAVKLKGSITANQFAEDAIYIFDSALEPTDRDYILVKVAGHHKITLRQVLIDGDDIYLKPLNPIFGDIQLAKNYTCYGVMVQTLINYR